MMSALAACLRKIPSSAVHKARRTKGLQVVIASDGREAVAAWQKGGLALILMDCQMPMLDGYGATKEIRTCESHLERIPIIALTAHAMKDADAECRAVGMDTIFPSRWIAPH